MRWCSSYCSGCNLTTLREYLVEEMQSSLLLLSTTSPATTTTTAPAPATATAAAAGEEGVEQSVDEQQRGSDKSHGTGHEHAALNHSVRWSKLRTRHGFDPIRAICI